MNINKVGIIGLGKMGLLHACILNSMPNVEVLGLCDKSWLLIKLFKKIFKNAKIVNKIEKFSPLKLDSVYITTPIPSHSKIIKIILENEISKNIFVEKTLTSSFDESKKTCSLFQTMSKGVNMVGYMKRFAVTFAKAKELLTREVIGKEISFNAYAYSSDFANIDFASKKSTSRGGVLSDLGSHIIDLGLWFFGDFNVESVSTKSSFNSLNDSVQFKVGKSNLEGNFDVSWLMKDYRMPTFGFNITGDKGIINVNDYNLQLKLNNSKLKEWFKHDLKDYVNFLLGESEYYREDEIFINSVLTSKQAEPSFETASKVDKIIDLVKSEGKKNYY